MAPRRRALPQRFLNVLRDLRARPRRWPWRIASSSRCSVQASRHQPPACLELRIAFAVRGRPDAIRLARCELAGITRIIEALDETIDSSEAQRFIDSIVVGDRSPPGVTLVEDEPHLRLRLVMIGEPFPPLLRGPCIKCLQSLGTHRTIAWCSLSANGGCKRLLGGPASVTLSSMIVKARVREGRLVVDEPTDLPDGTEIDLLPLDPGDWLDEADRAALHEALRQSDADVAAGRLVDAEEILKELRSR